MNVIKKLEFYKKQVAILERKASKAIVKKQKSDLRKVTALAKKLGYGSIKALLAGVTGEVVSVPSIGKRKRAKITDAMRKGIVADLKKGTPASKVAKTWGVSPATVNNTKKEAGLTKSRKAKKAPKKQGKKPKKVPALEGGSTATPSLAANG